MAALSQPHFGSVPKQLLNEKPHRRYINIKPCTMGKQTPSLTNLNRVSQFIINFFLSVEHEKKTAQRALIAGLSTHDEVEWGEINTLTMFCL